MYVLERKDFFGGVAYYSKSDSDAWYNDVDEISKATKFTLDDALKRSRELNAFGIHYRVVRVDD